MKLNLLNPKNKIVLNLICINLFVAIINYWILNKLKKQLHLVNHYYLLKEEIMDELSTISIALSVASLGIYLIFFYSNDDDDQDGGRLIKSSPKI